MDKLIANLAARFTDLTEDDILISVETIIDAMSGRLIIGGALNYEVLDRLALKLKLSVYAEIPYLKQITMFRKIWRLFLSRASMCVKE